MTTLALAARRSTPAYDLGAIGLLIGLGAILTALGYEHIGGYIPCPLCLMERYAYYAGIPLTFVALVLLSSGRSGAAAALLFVVALAYLANAGIGVYHAGAEWKFWPGPASCGTIQQIGTSAGGSLLDQLNSVKVIRCDEAPWRMFGLSFAGWNVVVSFGLSMLSLRAAFAARELNVLS